MRPVATPVWSARRKWVGNLVPALFCVPLAAFGIGWMAWHQVLLGLGLWLLVASQVVGWLALNQFGLFENAKMRAELGKILEQRGIQPGSERYFVGFATPGYVNPLDAHEDVGFLCLERDAIVFIGEARQVRMHRSQATVVRYRPNVHSALFLGRWVSVEGVVDGTPIRFLVEPREANTLFGNRRLSKRLKSRLEVWKNGASPGPKAGARKS